MDSISQWFEAERIRKQENQENLDRLNSVNPDGLYLTASGGSSSGSDNLAKVHRAEWQDYLARFAPIENMLFDRFNDAEGRAEAVEKAGTTMSGAFDRSKEQSDRSMSRYGLNLSEEKQARRDKSFDLKKAAGVAGAKNGMRLAKEDQRMGIMAGGLSSVKQQQG